MESSFSELSVDEFKADPAIADCPFGSPLVTCPTPSRRESMVSQASMVSGVSMIVNPPQQHVRVIVRVKPQLEADVSCLEWGETTVSVSMPTVEEEAEPAPARTPGRAPTTGRAPRTPGRTPGRAPTTPGRTPGRGAASQGRTSVLAPTTPGRTPGRASQRPRNYTFDAVLGMESTQSELFLEARPLVDAALGGANACILAYGQTGSGKTHTMMGGDGAPGIVPRAVDRIWEGIAEAGDETTWHVSLTYVELYNDGFRDLLAASNQPNQKMLVSEQQEAKRAQSAVLLREHKGARGRPPSAYLTGSNTFRTPVSSRAQLAQLLEYGHAARAVSSTSLNDRSSRSHAVITINIDSKPAGSATLRAGKLHLVDLAGSESLVGDVASAQCAETKAINVSLTALCDVLQALSRNSRRPRGSVAQPVPYRNHKLTRLLADSLGGNSHTLMIAAVQAAETHQRPTLTTLKFASRARDIAMVPGPVAGGQQPGGAGYGEVVALEGKIADLHNRLARRQTEIDALEELLSSRAEAHESDLAAKLAAARDEAAEVASALRGQIAGLVAERERAALETE